MTSEPLREQAILALLAAEQAALEKMQICQQQAEAIRQDAYAKAERIRQQSVARSQRWLYQSQARRLQAVQEKYENEHQALQEARPAVEAFAETSPPVQAWLEHIIGGWFDVAVSGSSPARAD